MATTDFNTPKYREKSKLARQWVADLEEILSHNYPSTEMKKRVVEFVKNGEEKKSWLKSILNR